MEAQTPKTKLYQIEKAVEILRHSFDLHKGLTVCADDLVSILPFLFVKARIDRLLAHFKFVSAFHISDEEGGQIEVYFTNFTIIVERILTFNMPEQMGRERAFTEVD